ncbi:MAG: glycosyltransferase [Planctomycetota bacterium]
MTPTVIARDCKQLHVVHVSFGLDIGGLEKLLVEFASATDRNRTRLSFVSLGDSGPIAEDIRRLDLPVICLHRGSGFRPSLVPDLASIFKKLQADVVHTHDPRPLIYGALAAKWAGVGKVVHTQHGRVFGETARQRWLCRQVVKHVDHFACVSNDIAILAKERGVPGEKLHVVHNGIRGERFRHSEARSWHDGDGFDAFGAQRRDNLVCVARLSPEKGVDTLIAAASLLIDDIPNFRLQIAGDGPCRAEVQSQIERLGLDDHVELLGQTDRVPDLLSGARLFVLPSNSEGVSLTLLEAMYAGVPVVATDVGGTPEVISHNGNGVLVPAKDPRAMARAIVELWNDPSKCRDLTREGYRVASDEFSIDRMLRRYDDLYGHCSALAAIARRVPQDEAVVS